MQVKQIGADYWQVTDGDRWWTVKSVANYGMRYWLITNSRGRVLNSTGATGQRVLAAIRATNLTSGR